jgi:hypothetical protein
MDDVEFLKEHNYNLELQLWISTMALWDARINHAHTLAHLFAWLSEHEPETLFTSIGIVPSDQEDAVDTRRALTADKWCRIWWNMIELLEEYKKTLEIRCAWGQRTPAVRQNALFREVLRHESPKMTEM